MSIENFFCKLMAHDVYYEYLGFAFLSNVIFPLHQFRSYAYSVFSRELAISAAPHALPISLLAYGENVNLLFHPSPLVRCAVNLPSGICATSFDADTHKDTRKHSVGTYNPSFDVLINWNVMAGFLVSICRCENFGLKGSSYAEFFNNYMTRTAEHLMSIYPRFSSGSSLYSIRAFNALTKALSMKKSFQWKVLINELAKNSTPMSWEILRGYNYLQGKSYEL